MPNCFFICFLLCCWLSLAGWRTYGQTPIVVHDTTEVGKLNPLRSYVRIYEGAFSDSLRFDVMKQGAWKSLDRHAGRPQRRDQIYSTWLRFTLQNTNQADTLRLLFYCGNDLLITTYFFEDNLLLSTFRTGWLRNTPLPDWAWSADNYASPIVVPPLANRSIWVNEITYLAPNHDPGSTLKLATVSTYNEFRIYRTWQNRWIVVFIGLVLAVCLFLSLSGLFQFLVIRDGTYLLWALYLMGTFLYFFRLFEVYTNTRFISAVYPRYFGVSLPPIQSVTQIGYFLFFDSFLKIKQYSQLLHRTILGFTVFLVVCLVYSLPQLLESDFRVSHVRSLIYNGIDISTLLFVMILLVTVSYKKIPLSRYLVVGTGSAYIGLFITKYINRVMSGFSITQVWDLPSFYFGMGILGEVFLFSIALSFRTRLIETEKNQLQHEYASSLQLELSKRTQEVRTQSKEAEEQRVHLLSSEFEQRIAETEMAALRAQMNPHFIFNCLNSIQFFTAQNDSEKASDYLTKFSRLIRLVLENSRSEKVTLANELDTLRLYIEMEAMRFPQKLHYRIRVDDWVDVDSIQMPPLLLQPFVENAIWHGLMHKEEGGTVTVQIQQNPENLLHIEITDDGIGRQRAAEFKSKSATKHKSFGMKLPIALNSSINSTRFVRR